MATIQSSINQALFSTSLNVGAFMRTPQGEAFQKKQLLNRQERQTRKALETEGKRLDYTAPGEPEYEDIQQRWVGHEKKLKEIAEEKYKLNPTEKNFRSVQLRSKDYEESVELANWEPPSPEEQARFSAERRSQTITNQRQTMNRLFELGHGGGGF